MKKLLLALLIAFSVLTFASCDLDGMGDIGNLGGILGNGNNNGNASVFDPNNVTMVSAYTEAQTLGFKGTLDEFIEMISGKDGADGADGVGISNVILNSKGHLLIILSNGKTVDCGKVTGADGKDGVNGTDGKDGVDGEDGKDGVDGTNGKSAYELYKEKYGYEGTEEQWLSDLINGKLVTDYHEHTFGEWVDYAGNASVYCENRLFYRICNDCKIIEWKSGSYDNHSFATVTTAPNCQAGGYDTKTCTICGKVEIANETEKTGHNYNKSYTFDDDSHWNECKNCGDKRGVSAHVIGDAGVCIVCDPSVQPTVGVLYDKSVDGTYAEVIGYSGSATKIVLADTYEDLPVKSIYKEAFKNSSIVSIVIPDSITMIGDGAFSYCSSLTSVVIGDSVTSIGNDAFYWCSSLTSVVIPDSVTSIGSSAFSYCFSLTSVVIGDSVTSIGSSAFYYCSSLTSVVIGDSVTSIGDGAFYNCSSLASVTIKGAPVIGSGAFLDCNSALYSEYELGRYVGDAENPYAILVVLTNKNLSTYTIHEDTRFIGSEVFKDCERLTNITIPDSVTRIGSSAFSYCSSLKSVVIGDSVTSIGNHAFYSCNSLISVVIGDSVTSIGNSAFSCCYSLTGVVIGDSVTSIGDDAFYNCSKLTSIKYRGTQAQWNAITKGSSWNYNTGRYTITYNYDGE